MHWLTLAASLASLVLSVFALRVAVGAVRMLEQPASPPAPEPQPQSPRYIGQKYIDQGSPP